MTDISPITFRRECTYIVSFGSVNTVIMMLMLTILLVFSRMVDAPLVTRMILDLWRYRPCVVQVAFLIE